MIKTLFKKRGQNNGRSRDHRGSTNLLWIAWNPGDGDLGNDDPGESDGSIFGLDPGHGQ